MKWFRDSEFTCKCSCQSNYMTQEFKYMIDKARDIAKTPFIITSGYRCVPHNTNIKASPTSSHTRGCACDIAYKDELQLVKIIFGLTNAGFCRIGINSKKHFIHVDCDNNKPDAIFTY